MIYLSWLIAAFIDEDELLSPITHQTGSLIQCISLKEFFFYYLQMVIRFQQLITEKPITIIELKIEINPNIK